MSSANNLEGNTGSGVPFPFRKEQIRKKGARKPANPALKNRRLMLKGFVDELSDEELELLPISIQTAIDSMVQTCKDQWNPDLFVEHYFRLRRFMEVASL